MIALPRHRPSWTLAASSRPRGAALSVVALIMYVASMIGVPVWETPGISSGEKYACQGRGCGCQSAAQCWSGCCCFTYAERIAWAEKHGVEVPAFARREVAKETKKAAARRSCCRATSSCASAAKSAACCEKKPATSGKSPAPRLRFVAGVAALKCQGITLGWQTLGEPAGPPPARFELSAAPRLAHAVVQGSARAIEQAYPPLTPPG